MRGYVPRSVRAQRRTARRAQPRSPGPLPAWLSLPGLLSRIKRLPHIAALDGRQRVGDLLTEGHRRGVDRDDHAVEETLSDVDEVRLAVGPQQHRREPLRRTDDSLQGDFLDQEALHAGAARARSLV